MPKNEPSPEVRQFLGLRNTSRPSTLPPGAMVKAENVDIHDAGDLDRRDGYSSVAGIGPVTAAFGTEDERELYVVESGTLKRIVSLSPVETRDIQGNVPAGEVWWAENGGYVFCSGAVSGVIQGDTFRTYAEFGGGYNPEFEAPGAEFAAPDKVSLLTQEADIGTLVDGLPAGPPPNTECVAFYRGCVWLSYYDAVSDQSFVFFSKPFHWSRWDLETDYIAFPGRVLLLCAPAESTLVVGTDRAIYLFAEGVMNQVADHGVVPGQHATEGRRAYFWTERGLCRAAPFEYVTDEGVSVPAGTRAAVVIEREQGTTRAVISTSGDTAAENTYG